MQKKVVIFGVGNKFNEYREKIEAEYYVVAYTSNNPEEKSLVEKYVDINEVTSLVFDFILVCCDSDVEIFNQLIDMGVDPEKIEMYRDLFHVDGVFHSEAAEDLTAFLLLELIGKADKPYYLDLGANHPIVASNTYGLYQSGGEGVLVEANPELRGIISKIRPRDQLINKAICKNGGGVKFYRLRQLGLGTLLYDEADKDTVNTHNNWDLMDSYYVDGITIGEVIDSLKREPDLMSIDLEGMDWAILHEIDFSVFRPAIIIAENRPWGYYEHSPEDFNVFFAENNYFLFRQTPGNGVYLDNKCKDKVKRYLPGGV